MRDSGRTDAQPESAATRTMAGRFMENSGVTKVRGERKGTGLLARRRNERVAATLEQALAKDAREGRNSMLGGSSGPACSSAPIADKAVRPIQHSCKIPEAGRFTELLHRMLHPTNDLR
jgi:hypothetical protein